MNVQQCFENALRICSDPKSQSVWISKEVIADVYSLCSGSKEEAQKFAVVFSRWLARHFNDFPSVQYTNAELRRSAEKIRSILPETGIVEANAPDASNQRWLTTLSHGNELVFHFAFAEMCNTQIGVHRHSANELWHDEKQRTALLQSLFKCRKPENFTASTLRHAAKFRHFLPSGFSPTLMKRVIDSLVSDLPGATTAASSSTTRATRGISVLDPCAGWGHRFVGFWASEKGQHYVGFDPNINLRAVYENLSTYLLNIDGGVEDKNRRKTCKFVCAQAESADFCVTAQAANDGNQFDLVMTCPPYFNVERYGVGSQQSPDDQQQSYVQYPSYELWHDGFLQPMIQNTTQCLRCGGLFAIVVKNCTGCESLCEDTVRVALSCNLVQKHTIHLCTSYKPDCETHEFLYIFEKKEKGNNCAGDDEQHRKNKRKR